MTQQTNGGVRFSSLFEPKEVLCQIEVDGRDALLDALLKMLAYERGIGNVGQALEAVLERESEMSTIVAPGIAMPHARLDSVDDLVIGVATSQKGVAYAEGSPPVHLAILILAPKTNPGLYLQAVSLLAAICNEPDTASTVSGLKSKEDVWRFFDRGGMVLPEHVCAGDIMRPCTAVLGEDDTLEKAITLFVRHDLIDLPVTDKEGHFVGVVTAHELLRVCLPDYILWMDDLSPILNFEPFAEILRNESNTWLAEIMTTEYATVPVDAPAVQVAKEVTRHHVEHAYVLKGKKLQGMVSLQGFLSKVLRE